MTARADGLPRRDKGKPMPRRQRERQRQAAHVFPADIRRARYFGVIAPSIKPLVSEMALELGELISDKGGPEAVTAAERMILEDVVRLGLIARATFAAYMAEPNPEKARTYGILTARRAAALAAVGLERRAKPITVAGVIEAIAEAKATAQNGSGATIALEPDPGPPDAA